MDAVPVDPSTDNVARRTTPATLLLALVLALMSVSGYALSTGAKPASPSALAHKSAEQSPAGQPCLTRESTSEVSIGFGGDANPAALPGSRPDALTVADAGGTLGRPSRRAIAFARIRDGLTRAPPSA